MLHRRFSSPALALLSLLFVGIAVGMPDAEPLSAPRRVQGVVERLRSELNITSPVEVAVVPANPLLVSVEPVASGSSASSARFVMSFEDEFLAGLADDELHAIVAHELGHVWIFTHHPYLQTERGANQVAMRAVSRTTLERVYTKVFERKGTKGDLAHFLGN